MKHKTLYPPAGGEPIKAHPTQVENLLKQGWSETAPKKGKKTKPTNEVNENGES